MSSSRDLCFGDLVGVSETYVQDSNNIRVLNNAVSIKTWVIKFEEDLCCSTGDLMMMELRKN